MAPSARLSISRAAACTALGDAREVAAHPDKHIYEGCPFFVAEARIGFVEDFIAGFPHLVEQRLRLVRQEELLRAPVVGIGPALHHAKSDELVDEPCHGDGLHFEEIGETDLIEPLMTRQMGKGAPLGLGEATHPFIEGNLHETGIVP